VAVLGLSFKPSADDLRESPIIRLIWDLCQDGRAVLVHDLNVQPETTLGSSRHYLERQLPRILQIFRPHIADVLQECQVVVVRQKRQEFIMVAWLCLTWRD
jgi:GDP-mannose 6-dehydrogenase